MRPEPEFVAVVDDNEENRYAVARFLARAGFHVLQGATGREALLLAERHPLLLVLDVRLPDMLGYDVCRQIKTNPLTAHVPILQTSASFTRSSDKTSGLDSGADAYLAAPFEPEELIATARALLRVHEAEKQAKSLAQQWQTTFDAINDPICLVGEHGFIERINKAFAEWIRPFSPHSIGSDFLQLAERAAFPGQPYHLARSSLQRQVTQYQANDSWYELRVDPIGQEHSGMRAVISWSDISGIKRAAQEIQILNSELEKRIASRTADLAATLRELEAFTYSIAHDLRAPLRAIEGFTGALVDSLGEPLQGEAQFFAQRIRGAAHRMDDLIQDLLQYARLGQVVPTADIIDPLPIIRQAAADVMESSATHAILRFPQEIPHLLANNILLRQVAANLFDNAFKYQPLGQTPDVAISSEEIDGFVRIVFRDNGIGISPDHFDRIFKVFERLHGSDSYSGTGIGLAIVRRSIELMGGRVGVESEPGHGSSFWIQLPHASEILPTNPS